MKSETDKIITKIAKVISPSYDEYYSDGPVIIVPKEQTKIELLLRALVKEIKIEVQNETIIRL